MNHQEQYPSVDVVWRFRLAKVSTTAICSVYLWISRSQAPSLSASVMLAISANQYLDQDEYIDNEFVFSCS